MTIIDTRGQLCPAPLIMTKRAISNGAATESFEIISDNDTARCNLLDYLHELGIDTQCVTEGERFRITFTLANDKHDGSTGDHIQAKAAASNPEIACPTPQKTATRGYAVVLRGNVMGSGDDSLGAILMRSCINSLGELETLPSVIIMYNSGVQLAVVGSDTARSFAELEARGVEIIVCGTCVDFYDIKQRLAVGKISNMYKINELLSRATKVVYP